MYDQVTQNKRRSALLILAFVAFTALVLAAIAYGVGLGSWGIAIAVLVATVFAFGSYWRSDQIALSASRAHPADPAQYARLHNLVEGLCIGPAQAQDLRHRRPGAQRVRHRSQPLPRRHRGHDRVAGEDEPRRARGRVGP